MPDLHRAPTTRDRRVFPTSRSPHPPLPFVSSFLRFFVLVASYDGTLGQGPKAAPKAE